MGMLYAQLNFIQQFFYFTHLTMGVMEHPCKYFRGFFQFYTPENHNQYTNNY